jgi:hypothetical protein
LAFCTRFTSADPAAATLEFAAKGDPLPANQMPLVSYRIDLEAYFRGRSV